jgi:starch synthase (maltosyl-transferring)
MARESQSTGSDLQAPLEKASGDRRPRAAARDTWTPPSGTAPSAAPRIYDLYPSLVGPVEAWTRHLPRIAAMGFNWVYVNSFHQPGASGSLYAVSDPFRLNAAFRGAAQAGDDELLAGFVAQATQHGLKAMMDVSIAHLARDSALVREHPAWFQRRSDGELLSAGTDMGRGPASLAGQDLAVLDYGQSAARDELLAYWAGYLRHYAGLGFAGFVARSADRLPVDVWRGLISGLRRDAPESRFVGEALGQPLEHVERLAGAGFDYLFNSARWWDFRAGWLLEQQPRLRRIAPTIAFPEHPDGERLAAGAAGQPGALEARLKFELLFAAGFSAGWMMPVGYEYGFSRRLDPVRSRPEDWEEPRIDLTAFVAAVNAVKADCPALDSEGALIRVTAPGASTVGLLRLSGGHLLDSDEAILLLLNPDGENAQALDTASLMVELGGRFDRFLDMTPLRSPTALDSATTLTLAPLELRLFRGEIARRDVQPRDPARAEAHLRSLARQRIAIEAVAPEVDDGRHPVKRVVGDLLEVSADIFTEGHDRLAACILYQQAGERGWHKVAMTPVDNDRWRGHFPVARSTTYLYTIEAWRDGFASWRAELVKKREAGQDIHLELEEGVRLVRAAAEKTTGAERERLAGFLPPEGAMVADSAEIEHRLLAPELVEPMTLHGERLNLTRHPHKLAVTVDRLAARCSAWYEMFPRSQSPDPARSGTFDDVIARLPYVRDLGFDVLYFPPIHPIGRTNRKGRNNSLAPTPDDPGSPYAIGGPEGGHTAIHPELGTIEDFRRLVRAAHAEGIEIALDFAIQCSLDHPWIREHPDWFDWRPDGSIKFAENPPKKYEDIVNVNFDKGFPALWYALRDVVLYWIEQGVKIFRVDNPHTKPVPFWEWMIGEVRECHPEVIFLSEAFTRPTMMRELAKAGFNQSYTYFTWRNTKHELTAYLTELVQSESRDYLRPNFFVNTPDINPFILQRGGRPAFMTRAVLAATLSPAYGIYSGYELCEAAGLPGREEYLDSEKYEIRRRDWDAPGNIRDYIARLNRIRRDNPALHDLSNLRFYDAFDNDILLYGKITPARDNAILVAVNLDPHNGHGCDFEIPLWEFGLPDHGSLQAEDLLGGGSFWWHGKIQHLWLDPMASPAVVWRIAPPGRAP